MGNLPDKSICQTYAARDQHSFDFLVCEGGRGWSATHSIGPFGVMMVFGHFLLSWLITGMVEILETLSLTLFKSYVIFHTNDAELETKAGSLLGDWLFNDLFGILLALFLLHGLGASGLISSWLFQKKRPPVGYRVKLVFATALILLPNLAPSWIIPSGCDDMVSQPCANTGLILNVGLQSAVILFFWGFLFRFPDDYRYQWKPHNMTDRKIHFYFGFWLAFVLLVGLQNAQPYIPLWNGSTVSEWTQVWLAEIIWGLAVLMIIYILKLHKEPQDRRT